MSKQRRRAYCADMKCQKSCLSKTPWGQKVIPATPKRFAGDTVLEGIAQQIERLPTRSLEHNGLLRQHCDRLSTLRNMAMRQWAAQLADDLQTT